jgi:hypothetical protein
MRNKHQRMLANIEFTSIQISQGYTSCKDMPENHGVECKPEGKCYQQPR